MDAVVFPLDKECPFINYCPESLVDQRCFSYSRRALYKNGLAASGSYAVKGLKDCFFFFFPAIELVGDIQQFRNVLFRYFKFRNSMIVLKRLKTFFQVILYPV